MQSSFSVNWMPARYVAYNTIIVRCQLDACEAACNAIIVQWDSGKFVKINKQLSSE